GTHDQIVVRLTRPVGHPREQVELLVEIRLRVLRHVTWFGILDPGDLAGGGLQLADQAARQSRLAHTVGANDGNPLTGPDVEADSLQNVLVRARIAERKTFDGDRGVEQLLALLEADVRVLPRGRPDLFELDLFELSTARGRLPRLRSVGREAAHEFLQIRDAVLGLGIRGLHALPRLQ